MDEKDIELLKCRVCLSSAGAHCVSLFEVYKNSMLFIYINKIANIDIAEGDRFPSNICKACLVQCEIAIEFREKCLLSNGTLRSGYLHPSSSFGSPKSEVKNEVLSDFEDCQYLDNKDNQYSEIYVKSEKDTGSAELCNQISIRPSRAIDLRLECHDCGDLFKSKCKLQVHWKKVHLPQALVCPVCKRTFKKYTAFNNHRKKPPRTCKTASIARIEGQGRSRVLYCRECSYKTRSVDSFVVHSVTHSGDKRFQCNYCQKWFGQSSTLSSHKETVHKEIRVEMTCQYCGKYMRGRSQVYRHLKTHTDNHHECPLCKKILSSKASLNIHMERHGGVKNFTCHYCASSFYSQSEVITHIRLRHEKRVKTAIFTCEACNYKTKTKYRLKQHIMRHTGTNFGCQICGLFCDDEERYKRHMYGHTNKNFKCSLCDARFAYKKSIWKHRRQVHSKLTLNPKPSSTLKKEDDFI